MVTLVSMAIWQSGTVTGANAIFVVLTVIESFVLVLLSGASLGQL